MVEMEDWNDTEILTVGRRDVRITLPETVWKPRVLLWAQGLETMTYLISVFNGEVD